MAFTTIDDPSAHFQSDLWTGNNTSRSITFGANSELQPDLAWIMGRDIAGNNGLIDSTRGVRKQLWADDQAAEKTSNSGSDLTAFNSDGISLGASHQIDCNTNTKKILGWFWKANGGTETHSQSESGTNLACTVQSNTTAGFSIVKYTGSGTAGHKFLHGLGVKPACVIVKALNSNHWVVYHHQNTSAPATDALALSTNAATYDYAGYFNDTEPTTTVVSVGNDNSTNQDGIENMAYCWNEVPGFSKFGIYQGNNSTDGTFVFLGFRPEVFIIKKTSATANWIAKTGKVNDHNLHLSISYLDITNAENLAQNMDVLSNGFKHRSTEGDGNHVQTYAYFAWARHPMVSSKGIPGTAV